MKQRTSAADPQPLGESELNGLLQRFVIAWESRDITAMAVLRIADLTHSWIRAAFVRFWVSALSLIRPPPNTPTRIRPPNTASRSSTHKR